MKLNEIHHQPAEDEIGPITPHNVNGKYRVGKVLIDNVHGLGATPYNANVHYMGFVGFIKPSVFLELAKIGGDKDARSVSIENAMGEKGLGNPFLIVYVHNVDPWDEMQISGHEGRARMAIIQRLNGDEPFPVHFFPKPEISSRHLDAKFFEVFQTDLKSERGSSIKVNLSRIFCGGKEIK